MTRKQKTSVLREQQSLENRWVFDLAYRLMDEYNVTRSEALRRAHLTRELMDALGRGEVHFRYEKQDGTLREARGTLRHGISEAYDNYEYKTELSEKDYDTRLKFTYWDLDRGAFRSFRAENVVKICAVSIPNYMER